VLVLRGFAVIIYVMGFFFVFFWLFLQVFLIGEFAAACVFFLPCYTGCVISAVCAVRVLPLCCSRQVVFIKEEPWPPRV